MVAMVRQDSIPTSPADQRGTDEQKLVDLTERLKRQENRGRTAVQIHLSRLQNHNRRDHHIRVAIAAFDDLIRDFNGTVFRLINHDIVFVCNGARIEDIDSVVLRLRYLFSEDPLTRLADEQCGGGFCTWFLLATDLKRFGQMAKRAFELGEAHRQESQRIRRSTVTELRPSRSFLTPTLLGKLERALASAELSSLVRNQPICAIRGEQPPERLLYELFVSIDGLQETLVPEVDLSADPWLFQRLSQSLDARMLTLVLNQHQNTDRAFSLNLNISTILSPEFQRFDQGIGLGARGRIMIEVQKVDIFCDMGAFVFARDYLRERGYKICLDGLTHLTLPYIDRERLGIDMVKMYWSSELISSLRPDQMSELRDQIAEAGNGRVILCRCDSENPVRIGHALGVSLFQGRFVDRLLAADRGLPPREPARATRPGIGRSRPRGTTGPGSEL